MTKNYYRSEYSDKQWKALIDKATELGCQITYSKYGNIVTIDSTDRESRIIATTGRDGQDRAVWAERIHGMIQESTNLKVWKVQPKRYHKGYCPTICKSRRVAKLEQERLERITGFEWGNKSNDGITWQQETINLSTCYSTDFNAIAITILAMAAETLSIVFGPMMSRNKSIKCESFTICCRLNLSGSQENKLMNMQQEWV